MSTPEDTGRSAPPWVRAVPDAAADALPLSTPVAERLLAERGIPEATVARLPVYLRALNALVESGVRTVASEELASAAGVRSATLRRDLSHLGSYGVRGVGYEVAPLVTHVSRELGVTQEWRVVLVGVGNLGRALASHGGFAERGTVVVGLFDADPAVVGQEVAGTPVRPMADLAEVVAAHGVCIGVLATPGDGAQEACDALVAAGVTGVLTFAPAVLQVPEGVDVRKVDLASELQILAFHEQRKAETARGGASAAEASGAGPEQSGTSPRPQGLAARAASHVPGRARTARRRAGASR